MVKTINDLCAILGYDKDQLKSVIEKYSSYYYQYSQIKKDKTTNKPIVKNGIVQKRVYNPSRGELKNLQGRIQTKILTRVPLISNIQGGIKRKSSIGNANFHKGSIYRFQTDITSFFPSISRDMVFRALRSKGFSKQVSNIIAELTTLKKNESDITFLPQGTKTSPMLANIVFEKTDLQLLELIKEKDIIYTRWFDDLTFSSKNDFHDLIPSMIQTITKNGFKISRGKTSYRKNKSVITGVVAGLSTLKVSDDFRNKDEKSMGELQILGRKSYKDQVYRTSKKKT